METVEQIMTEVEKLLIGDWDREGCKQKLREWAKSIVEECKSHVSIYAQECEQEGREMDSENLEVGMDSIKQQL